MNRLRVNIYKGVTGSDVIGKRMEKRLIHNEDILKLNPRGLALRSVESVNVILQTINHVEELFNKL